MMLRLELFNDHHREAVQHIDRSDISEDWVDSIPDILDLHQYGLDHGCIGHTYAVYADDACIGIILMGEGYPGPATRRNSPESPSTASWALSSTRHGAAKAWALRYWNR